MYLSAHFLACDLLVIFRLIAVQLILIILLYLLERLHNRNSNLKLVLSMHSLISGNL